MATLLGFHVAKKYGLGVNGLRHYSIQQIVDCMLHLKCKTLDPEDSTFEESFLF
ncbi:hypothetical protein OROHE_005115 [Orobanche hederae]